MGARQRGGLLLGRGSRPWEVVDVDRAGLFKRDWLFRAQPSKGEAYFFALGLAGTGIVAIVIGVAAYASAKSQRQSVPAPDCS